MRRHRLLFLLVALLISTGADARFEYSNFKTRALRHIPEPRLHIRYDAPPDSGRRRSVFYSSPADSIAAHRRKAQKWENGREGTIHGSIVMGAGAAVYLGAVAYANTAQNPDEKPALIALAGLAVFTIGLGLLIGGLITRAIYKDYRTRPR